MKNGIILVLLLISCHAYSEETRISIVTLYTKDAASDIEFIKDSVRRLQLICFKS